MDNSSKMSISFAAIIGIIIRRPPTNPELMAIIAKLEPWVANPNASFIFSDECLAVARYFSNIGYRKCTVLHTGTKPTHNVGQYTTKSFLSYEEINFHIRKTADHYIDIKEDGMFIYTSDVDSF